MMKPTEANNKFCPFALNHPGNDCWCGAVKCMAWVVIPARCLVRIPATPIYDDDAPEPERPEDLPASWVWVQPEDGEQAFWVEPPNEASARDYGYCKLIYRYKQEAA